MNSIAPMPLHLCQVDLAESERAETQELLQSTQENCSRSEQEVKGCREAMAVLQATVKELQAQVQTHKEDAQHTHKVGPELDGWVFPLACPFKYSSGRGSCTHEWEASRVGFISLAWTSANRFIP